MAQDATWVLNPVILGTEASFLNSANWSTGSVPTGTATFGASNTTSIIFAAPVTTTLNTFHYLAGAPSYFFSILDGTVVFLTPEPIQSTSSPNTISVSNAQLIFKNTSDAPATFLVANSGANVLFQDSSTAVTTDVIGNNGSVISFRDSAHADANMTVNGGSIINFQNTSTAGTARIGTNDGGTVRFFDASSAGSARIVNGGATSTLSFQDSSTAGSANILNSAGATTYFLNSATAGSASIANSNFGSTTFNDTSSAGGATIVNGDTGDLGTLTFKGNSTANVANITNNNGGFTFFADTSTAGSTNIVNNFAGTTHFLDNSTAGSATISGSSVSFTNASRAGSATINTSFIDFEDASSAGTATVTTGTLARFFGSSSGDQARFISMPGSTFDISGLTAAGMTAGSIEGAGTYMLGSKQLSVGSNNLSTEVSGSIVDGGANGGTGGSLVKEGGGTLILSGMNTYTGGTTIDAGVLQLGKGGTTGSIVGDIVIRPLGRPEASLVVNRSDILVLGGNISGTGDFRQLGSGTTILTGTNTYSGGTLISAGTLQLGNGGTTGSISPAHGFVGIIDNSNLSVDRSDTVVLDTAISGTGAFQQIGGGTTILRAGNTYTGPTSVSAGRLAVNGSITSDVTVSPIASLGGTGIIFGSVMNGGALSPGNSIGTLTINGSYLQAAGSTYQVEVNAAGQGDLLQVNGTPGTATIAGGTVNVLATPGTYGKTTRYTILNATAGVTGIFAGLTSNFAFLQPSLTYDPNNVFLTLDLLATAFSEGGRTPNQKSVGRALDQAFLSATGEFTTALANLAGLDTTAAPAALDALGGEIYSGLAASAIVGSRLFMTEVGRQMSLARTSPLRGQSERVALAQGCLESCDARDAEWSAWGSALGATGVFEGDGNAHTLTFTTGGFAGGVDHRVGKGTIVGIGAAYTNGTRYLAGLDGRGTTDIYNAGLYGSYAPGPFYVDALVGYGYINDQVRRSISLPGMASQSAFGRTQANQFLGQLESGYSVSLDKPVHASLTPFARLQSSSTTQAGLRETGAGTFNLNIQGSTTNSVRTTIGAEAASDFDMGWSDKLALKLRLGWGHEFANDSHPVTASFAGAPFAVFTVFGAVPRRDDAVVGFSASSAIARATQLYLRYDGDISSTDSSHAASVGVRFSW